LTIIFAPIRDFFTGSELDFCPFSEPDHPEKPGKPGKFDLLNARSSDGVFKNAGGYPWKAWKIRHPALTKKGKSRAKQTGRTKSLGSV
jgi:hypothetical protein